MAETMRMIMIEREGMWMIREDRRETMGISIVIADFNYIFTIFNVVIMDPYIDISCLY